MPAAYAPDTVPDHLLADSAWRAALHLLTADLFAHDGRVWAHVDLDQGFIDFAAILAESWSSGERRLLGAAASLFGAEPLIGLVDLTELVGGLDDTNWGLLLGALALRRAGICGSAWPLDLAELLAG
jgi:hypothetical protein